MGIASFSPPHLGDVGVGRVKRQQNAGKNLLYAVCSHLWKVLLELATSGCALWNVCPVSLDFPVTYLSRDENGGKGRGDGKSYR